MADEGTPSDLDLQRDFNEAIAGMKSPGDTSPVSAGQSSQTSVVASAAGGNGAAPNNPLDGGLAHTQTKPETEFVPEDIRSEFASLSPKALSWLHERNDGAMRRDEFTHKTQDFARYREAWEADHAEDVQAALLWRRLEKDRPAYQHLSEFLERRKSGGQTPTSDDDVPDLDWTDPEGTKKRLAVWQKRVMDTAAKSGESAAQRTLHETFVVPREREAAKIALLRAELIERRGMHEDDASKQVALRILSAADRLKMELSPENVTGLADLVLGQAPAQAANKPEPTRVAPNGAAANGTPNGVAGPRMVASPSLGGGAVAPPLAPVTEREKRGPLTREEFHRELLRDLSREWGEDTTSEDVKKVVFSPNNWGIRR